MRGAIVLFAGLALAAADAAPPMVTATATPASGVAPLRVTLTAAGDAATYAWDLGDGSTAVGPVVTHVYAAGRFVATVTATSAAGEIAQAQVPSPPSAARCRSRRRRRGLRSAPALDRLAPASRAGGRVQIYRGNTTSPRPRGANGRFRTRLLLRSPGPYHAALGAAARPPGSIAIRPRLEACLPRVAPVGAS